MCLPAKAALQAQELEASAAAAADELRVEHEMHHARCRQQALEAEAIEQRLLQERAAVARQAAADDPHAWLVQPGEQAEHDAALAACVRDWEAQVADQQRLLWKPGPGGGGVIEAWVEPTPRPKTRPRDVVPPEIIKKLQEHLKKMAAKAEQGERDRARKFAEARRAQANQVHAAAARVGSAGMQR